MIKVPPPGVCLHLLRRRRRRRRRRREEWALIVTAVPGHNSEVA